MIHIYDAETSGHLLTSEHAPHDTLKEGQQLQIDIRTNDTAVQYMYYISAIEQNTAYAMVYVTLQKVYVNGTIVSIP